MVAVKIECGCGQHYAFDVEPVNGQTGFPVACPACGADGTSAANEIIARSLAPTASAATGSLRISGVAAPAPATPPPIMVDPKALGLVDRPTAENEARAKISWGDAQEDVIKFLMLNGFTVPEATDFVQSLYQERLATVRSNGISKMLQGGGLMLVPVITFIIFTHFGVMPIKLMGIAMAVGLFGAWLVLKGLVLLLAPKMETGDVADN